MGKKTEVSAIEEIRRNKSDSRSRAVATRTERLADVEADTIRAAILEQMETSGILRSELATLVAGSVGKDSIYRFLGDDATPINSRYASAILGALGLEIRPIQDDTGKPKAKREARA